MSLRSRLSLVALLLAGLAFTWAADAAQELSSAAKYQNEVMMAIERAAAEIRTKKPSDGAPQPGSISLAFTITPSGEVYAIEASEREGAWQPVREFWNAAIYAAKFPKPPRELLEDSPSGAMFRYLFAYDGQFRARPADTPKVVPSKGEAKTADASSPPLTPYQKDVLAIAQSIWKLKVSEYQDLAQSGVLSLKFRVTATGAVSQLEIVEAKGSDLVNSLVIAAIQKREFPKPPPDVLEQTPKGAEFEINFEIKPNRPKFMKRGTAPAPDPPALSAYRKEVYDMVEPTWEKLIEKHRDRLGVGKMGLRFMIAPDGKVTKTEVLYNEGLHTWVQDLALQAILTPKFSPPPVEHLGDPSKGLMIDLDVVIFPPEAKPKTIKKK